MGPTVGVASRPHTAGAFDSLACDHRLNAFGSCSGAGRLALAPSRCDPMTQQQQDMAACCTPRACGTGGGQSLASTDTCVPGNQPFSWWTPLEELAGVAIVRQGSRAELEGFSATVRGAILAALGGAESDARWRGSGVSELLRRALQLEMSTCTQAARDLAVQLAGFKALAAQVQLGTLPSLPAAGEHKLCVALFVCLFRVPLKRRRGLSSQGEGNCDPLHRRDRASARASRGSPRFFLRDEQRPPPLMVSEGQQKALPQALLARPRCKGSL